MAAPQRPCPLPSNARRAGIESRDEERKQRLAERSRVERSFMKARANRLWIHAAFAATHVAAHAGASGSVAAQAESLRLNDFTQHIRKPAALQFLAGPPLHLCDDLRKHISAILAKKGE